MKIFATGRVHPERADINFPKNNWTTKDGTSVTVRCEASQLFVEADLHNCDDFVTAYLTVEQVSQAVVSAFGFSLGTGYSVELIQLIEESGENHIFGARPHGLGFEPWEPIFVNAINLAKKDVCFRFALRDYTRAIVSAVDCASYCFRAIEAIKSAFDSQNDKEGWVQMHAALNTNKVEIDTVIKEYADPVRHGSWVSHKPSHSDQRFAMLQLTRTILEKYLQYSSTLDLHRSQEL